MRFSVTEQPNNRTEQDHILLSQFHYNFNNINYSKNNLNLTGFRKSKRVQMIITGGINEIEFTGI